MLVGWYQASDISLAEDNYHVVANELGMCDGGQRGGSRARGVAGGLGSSSAGVTNNVVVADCDCDSYCDSDCDVDSLICLGSSLMKSF